VLLDSRYAMWMLWGPGLTFFCNDAYLPTVGIKRDWVLGARSDKVWEEIWPDIGPRIGQVLARGEATWDERLLLFLERSGFPEETYHTFSYSPIYDDDSVTAGMLCVVTEVTERVIGERRLRLLRDLAASGGADGVEQNCRRACEVLALYPFDAPFAALYLIERGTARAAAPRAAGAAVADPGAAGDRDRAGGRGPAGGRGRDRRRAVGRPGPARAAAADPEREPGARRLPRDRRQPAARARRRLPRVPRPGRGPDRGADRRGPGLRGGAPARRAAGGDGSRQDRVLLQREP
jgi:hypothetical protein